MENDLWLSNAKHANAMAALLRMELEKSDQVSFTQKTESNQLFLTLPHDSAEKLALKHAFFYWNEGINEIRLVTSFDTTEKDVHTLVNDIKEALL